MISGGGGLAGRGGAERVPADQPVVTAFDQGLGRGDGVFESVAGHRRRNAAPRRAPGPAGALRGAAGARRPGPRRPGAPWSTPSSPAGPPTSKAPAGCSSPAGSARAARPPRWRCSRRSRRTCCGSGPRASPWSASAWASRPPSGRGAVAARRREDAVLRGQHGRAAARARARRRRRRLHLAGGPAARGADVDRRLGRRRGAAHPAAGHRHPRRHHDGAAVRPRRRRPAGRRR